MLIEHGVWEEDNDDEDIAADIPENIMDERIINIQNGPVDQSQAMQAVVIVCSLTLRWKASEPYWVQIWYKSTCIASGWIILNGEIQLHSIQSPQNNLLASALA